MFKILLITEGRLLTNYETGIHTKEYEEYQAELARVKERYETSNPTNKQKAWNDYVETSDNLKKKIREELHKAESITAMVGTTDKAKSLIKYYTNYTNYSKSEFLIMRVKL